MSEQLFSGYALLIGINFAFDTSLCLPIAGKDIEALYALLTDPEVCAYPKKSTHVRKLTRRYTTRTDILSDLNWLQKKAQADPQATIFIYYSGHGYREGNTDRFYLLPCDTDWNNLPNTAISAETLTQAIQAIPSQQLLVVIDSCHAAEMATLHVAKEAFAEQPDRNQFSGPPRDVIDALKARGKVVFTAAAGNQKSWNRPDGLNGIYTYHFLEALSGINNRSGDQVVKVSNLMNYLSRSVPESTYQLHNQIQTPQFDLIGSDFAVAKIRGGKGIPAQDYPTTWSEINQGIYQISQAVDALEKGNENQYDPDQYIYEPNQCVDRQGIEQYLQAVLDNLKTQGCVDVRQNITHQGQTFNAVVRIVDFEINWQFLVNTRGEAFFLFAEFSVINLEILMQFSSRCLQWAKTQTNPESLQSALWNLRIPTHYCFAVALVDRIEKDTRIQVQTYNPFERSVDLIWYTIPVIYELQRRQLFYYNTPRTLKDQMTGELVWKKLREIIDTNLTSTNSPGTNSTDTN